MKVTLGCQFDCVVCVELLLSEADQVIGQRTESVSGVARRGAPQESEAVPIQDGVSMWK